MHCVLSYQKIFKHYNDTGAQYPGKMIFLCEQRNDIVMEKLFDEEYQKF
jgi:hypothetical protein